MELEKRAIDKMRFYGGLGKRYYDSYKISFFFFNYLIILLRYEMIEDDSDEMHLDKRLDRMKYFGALGKRNSNYLSNKLMNSKRLDKMKYFGGLGKRSDFYPNWKDNQLRYLLAKKSNFDRMRFLGNLGK